MTHSSQTLAIISHNEHCLSHLHAILALLPSPIMIYPTPSECYRENHIHHIHCLLLDMQCPEHTCLDVIDNIKQRAVALPVIAFTSRYEPTLTAKALQHGAFDVLTVDKHTHPQTWLESINAALRWQRQLAHYVAQFQGITKRLNALTRREREVTHYLFSGCMSKVIAYELGITLSTIELHRRHIFEKTDTRNIAELVGLIVVKNQLAAAIAQPPWAQTVYSGIIPGINDDGTVCDVSYTDEQYHHA